MRSRIIVVAASLVLLGTAGAGYWYYDTQLRFTDGFTACPVLAFREAATDAGAAAGFVTEANMVSLAITERCGLDCRKGNRTACVVYGLALERGVFVMQRETEARDIYKQACGKGEALGCELEAGILDGIHQREKQAAAATLREASKDVLAAIGKRKAEVGRVMRTALDHFGGREEPMTAGTMRKWYEGTEHYLLYEKPLLSQFHKTGQALGQELALEEFVLAKYMGGQTAPDYYKVNEFFEKLMRLGVMQIKLDYRVERKQERDIPPRHGYWKAKHAFLYNVGRVEISVLDTIDKEIRSGFEGA
jgi:TPR repeat protein